MQRRQLVTAMTLAAWSAAAGGGGVASLVEKVRSALNARQSDAEVARAVDAGFLTERLDDAVIEQLQSEGAGPQTVEELERLRDLSSGLTGPAQPPKLFDAPPAPIAEEQAAALEKARTFATHYTANLPNFLCRENVRRYASSKEGWKSEEPVTWEVGFSDQREQRRLVGFGGEPTDRQSVRGTSSSGEFGGVLDLVFRAESLTRFAWERWANLNGRMTYVFSFRIDRKQAQFLLAAGALIHHRAYVGMRGMVYVDRETLQVRRILYEADGVPKGFAIAAMHTLVDYDYSDIGGEKFLLPRRSSLRIVAKDNSRHRNVTEFANYRKFSGEAKIDFEKQ
jgi:hypothetical protein